VVEIEMLCARVHFGQFINRCREIGVFIKDLIRVGPSFAYNFNLYNLHIPGVDDTNAGVDMACCFLGSGGMEYFVIVYVVCDVDA